MCICDYVQEYLASVEASGAREVLVDVFNRVLVKTAKQADPGVEAIDNFLAVP